MIESNKERLYTFGYVRESKSSTRKDEAGKYIDKSNTNENQKEIVTNKCQEHNNILLKTYEDRTTASTEDTRENYPIMMRAIKNSQTTETPIKMIYVKETSRLGRNDVEVAIAVRDLDKMDVDIFDCSTNTTDRVVRRVRQAMSSVETDIKRQRVNEALDSVFRSGKGVITTTKLGYRLQKYKNKAPRLLVVKQEFDVLKQIFADKMTGMHTNDIWHKYQSTVKALLKKKYLGKSHRKFSATRAYFNRILQDPIYAGFLIQGSRMCVPKQKHQPVVSIEDFLRLNPSQAMKLRLVMEQGYTLE